MEIWLFSNSGHGDVRAKNETAPTDDELTDNYQWWTSSPDEFGNIAQLYEVHSALGSQVMNYWDDMNTGELKHIGGPESMHASATACYTGVTE